MQEYNPTRSPGGEFIIIRLSYVAVVPSLSIWVDSWTPSAGITEPFLVHTTVVAGEPVEVQLRVSAKFVPETN